MAPFARALVRKSKRALKVAGLALDAGDNDSAVSRCYYAMFDIACAALLRAGVAEDKLPRTHNGLVEAFRKHAVQSGQIDRELGAELSRIESLRIKADYTGAEIELEEALEVVRKAELFVQTVERVFGLGEQYRAAGLQDDKPDPDDKISEPGVATAPVCAEEQRRQARENWLRFRQQQTQGAKRVEPRSVSDRGAEENRSPSLGDDE